MRLTKQTDTKEGTTIGMPKAVAAYWKLKEYEDLEEELDIDLITLFDELKDTMAMNTIYGLIDAVKRRLEKEVSK